MNCVNPVCEAEALCLRSGGISAVGRRGGSGSQDECQPLPLKLIWLSDACEAEFAVQRWIPEEQERPIRSRSTQCRAFARSESGEIGS
jgi:hypothetical protein